MPRTALQFPSLERWRTMSEREQDALLDRMEALRRRTSIRLRLRVGLDWSAAAAAASALVYLTLIAR